MTGNPGAYAGVTLLETMTQGRCINTTGIRGAKQIAAFFVHEDRLGRAHHRLFTDLMKARASQAYREGWEHLRLKMPQFEATFRSYYARYVV